MKVSGKRTLDCSISNLLTLANQARAAPLKLFALCAMSDYAHDLHAWRTLSAQ